MLIALAAAAACGQAGAAPASGIAPPAGWQALPELATSAKDALGTTVTVDGAEAWGEPAMGCYGVWLAVRAAGDAEAIATQVIDGFAAPEWRPAGSGGAASGGPESGPVQWPLAVRDVVKPTGAEGVLALGFDRAPYRGRLRARLGGERIVALACFANQREPAACEAACTQLLGAIP